MRKENTEGLWALRLQQLGGERSGEDGEERNEWQRQGKSETEMS